MSFSRARFPGTWTAGSSVSPGEFEHIDDYAYAIDGKDGGTYAPSALLTIGGTGVDITAPFNAPDAQVIDVWSTLSIRGGATLSVLGTETVSGTFGLLSGSFMTVHSGATITLNATSTLNSSGAININGGTFTCNVQSSFTLPIYQGGKLYKSGATATTVWRVTQIASNQPNVTLDRSADTWWVDTPLISPTTYTIDESTVPVATNGERLSVHAYNVPVGFNVILKREDASVIAVITDLSLDANGGVDLQFMGGRWRVVGTWGDAGTVDPY